MNNHIFNKGILAVLLAGALASCSSDYLDERPIVQLDNDKVGASVQTAQMAIYGMCRAMQTQYQETSLPSQFGGEGHINTVFLESLGPDYNDYLIQYRYGPNFSTWKNFQSESYSMNTTAWMYCYNFINQANTILSTIADAEGDEAQREFVEAQARTFRAFGYIKAMQLFGPRWQDSNKGEAAAVVLRTEPGSGPCPLGTFNEVLDLIYDDLSKAEALFEKCGLQRSNTFEPDLHVAYGLHARAALIRNDWKTARTAAHKGREGMPLMSNDDLFKGFTEECPGYLWVGPENDTFYYMSAAWYAPNGPYHSNWGMGISISMDLYNALDPNDVRRDMFFTPDKVAVVAAMPGSYDDIPYSEAANITEADFFNPNMIDLAAVDYVAAITEDNPKANAWMALTAGYALWIGQHNANLGQCVNLPFSLGLDPTSMVFGAGCKMYTTGQYGDSKYPFMRVAELIITEAEAAYMDGDEETAKACLTEINSVRIPGYVCKTSGQALLDEIRVCRRIELWGEGFNFPDFKRWNIHANKKSFLAGKPAVSGSCSPQYSFDYGPEAENGWRLAIPKSETDFNPAIDRSKL